MTSVRRLFVLLCGYEILPITVSLRGANPRFIVSVPICTYLLDTEAGWVLFDAGLDSHHLTDPAQVEKYFSRDGWFPPPVVEPVHEMEEQLRQIGIGFEDISILILSHLHADHSGHIKRMPQAEIIIQKREYDYAFSDEPKVAYFPEDYDLPGLNWTVIDGDQQLMPGIDAIFTPGHTPGHQSLVIDLPSKGKTILTADVGDWIENFTQEILPGSATNDEEAIASIHRINDLHQRTDGEMFLTHDPVLVRKIKLAPDYYV
ncbi:N-acyl homoserine lactonase [Devosia pacifica]|uniref:N-acyl homoserine lactonase n=1 Tax=Devosia pacifica TaxID=1335967 RepID=A0A918RVA2_9HYPH|nr:N-acyl homoserine lactonase family protein [Devosia pacifica]GHA13880.1 N-acyl homoserine lactonase [Devosia pacifica]